MALYVESLSIQVVEKKHILIYMLYMMHFVILIINND